MGTVGEAEEIGGLAGLPLPNATQQTETGHAARSLGHASPRMCAWPLAGGERVRALLAVRRRRLLV
jgi:hypothetical protein